MTWVNRPGRGEKPLPGNCGELGTMKGEGACMLNITWPIPTPQCFFFPLSYTGRDEAESARLRCF